MEDFLRTVLIILVGIFVYGGVWWILPLFLYSKAAKKAKEEEREKHWSIGDRKEKREYLKSKFSHLADKDFDEAQVKIVYDKKKDEHIVKDKIKAIDYGYDEKNDEYIVWKVILDKSQSVIDRAYGEDYEHIEILRISNSDLEKEMKSKDKL